MSVKLMNLVWEADSSQLAGIEKSILLRMADFAADDGSSIYPSLDRLERDIGFSRRPIQYAISNMVKKGVLKKIESTGVTNRYYIVVDKLTSLKTPVLEQHPCWSSTRAGAAPDQSINISYREILSNNHEVMSTIQDPARGVVLEAKSGWEKDFGKFWEVYPVKKGRQKAKQAFFLGKCHLDMGLILKSLESQILEREHRAELNLFAPEWAHPTTWLNQKRWEDETVPLEVLKKQSAKNKASKMSSRDRANMSGMERGRMAIQRIAERAKQIEAEALR